MASPIVTAIAAHVSPSCRIPHNDFVQDPPQRPEHGRSQDHGDEDPDERIGKVAVFVALGNTPMLEVADLPEERAGDRELDRDDGLEVLNGDTHRDRATSRTGLM